ncbi:ATPase [Methylovirgula sp. 4M-Z18]|nr:ATPase [Methylovirgula sp. 4M-Z18]
MREDLSRDLLPLRDEAVDPIALARRDLRKNLPKRFYSTASTRAEDGLFALLLDGKPALTPQRKRLDVARPDIADLIAAEWNRQEEYIDPATMPLTRLVNSALDGVAATMADVRAEIVKYAGSDLLCYRAGEPDALAQAQSAAWDPILAIVRQKLGVRFNLAEGVMFVMQDPAALAAVEAEVASITDPLRLAALSVATTLTGSALIALTLRHGTRSAEQAWAAAHVDEDFQIRAWGEDAEAKARRERRWQDFHAATLCL